MNKYAQGVRRHLLNSPFALTMLGTMLALTMLILGLSVNLLDLSLLAGLYSVEYLVMAGVQRLLLRFLGVARPRGGIDAVPGVSTLPEASFAIVEGVAAEPDRFHYCSVPIVGTPGPDHCVELLRGIASSEHDHIFVRAFVLFAIARKKCIFYSNSR